MNKSIIILMLIGCLIMSSFTLSPFSTIQSTNPINYASYQIKLTYTSSQTKSRPSLLLCGSARLPNITEFTAYSSNNISYLNDESGYNVVVCTSATIKKFIDEMALRPELKTSALRNKAFMSIMIEKGVAPSEFVFEHQADYKETFDLLNILEGAFLNEPTVSKEMIRVFRNYTLGHH